MRRPAACPATSIPTQLSPPGARTPMSDPLVPTRSTSLSQSKLSTPCRRLRGHDATAQVLPDFEHRLPDAICATRSPFFCCQRPAPSTTQASHLPNCEARRWRKWHISPQSSRLTSQGPAAVGVSTSVESAPSVRALRTSTFDPSTYCPALGYPLGVIPRTLLMDVATPNSRFNSSQSLSTLTGS